MTLKSIRLFTAISVSAGSLFLSSLPAAAARERGIDLLVVPVKYTPLQVAFDTIKKRDLILVGYEGEATTSDPILHVWNGLEWIPITDEQFKSSTYLSLSPERIVLVGDDQSLPTVLVDAAKSNPSAKVLQIPHLDTASLLGSLGKVYDFNSREWKWFAARYKLELSDRNAELRKISYYDQPIAGRAGWPPWKKSTKSDPPSSPSALSDAAEETTNTNTESSPAGSAPKPAVVVTAVNSSSDPEPSLTTEPVDWEEKAVAADAPAE
jgi:hypothetical protein